MIEYMFQPNDLICFKFDNVYNNCDLAAVFFYLVTNRRIYDAPMVVMTRSGTTISFVGDIFVFPVKHWK